MTQDERDEAIAAAMEAALDYEDAPPAWVRGRWRIEGKNTQEGTAMLDREKLAELEAACGELTAAEEKVVRICAEIAGVTPAALLDEMTAAHPRRLTGRGRPKAAGRPKGTGTPHIKPEPGQVNQPWRKVKCPVCSAKVGSRVVKDVRYPAAHYTPGTQGACPGREKPVAEIAAAAGGES